jgi:sialic acid synthase SpsE
MSQVKIGGHLIGGKSPTFIIAEVGSNHDGKLEQAYRLIDAAKIAGADAIKFQIFKASRLYPKNIGTIKLNNKEFNLYNFLEKSEVPYNWVPKLRTYCRKKRIIFLATPFDEESAEILDKNNIVAYKIASSELNHIPLIRYIAKKGKPMIMSEGLSGLSDIELAIDTVKKEGNDKIIILHCLSAYPAPMNELNLNFIKTLINVFGVVAGFSDHTTDPVLAPTLAVCNGAKVIEKHLSINKQLTGADHFYALEPGEFKQMVEKVREVDHYSNLERKKYLSRHKKILGSYRKVIAPCEQEIYPGDKRSIFSVQPIKKGEKFSRKNIAVLRAERFLTPGLHPKYFDLVLKKTAKRTIKAYKGIEWSDILD